MAELQRSGALDDVPALVAQLTVEEKASLTTGRGLWHTAPVERLGIPSVMLADGPHGLRRQSEDLAAEDMLAGEPATCFPPAVGLASSWNPNLVHLVGDALGREARAADVGVLLGPGVNLKRSPLCGRNFEYFSEDPLLSGELATAFVDGVQRHGVGTSLKHFAANNQETDRARVSAEVDERTLRELYLPAFERVVTRARPWTVMAAYNRINGVFCTESPWLLTEVLRQEWGFDGVVVSDWGAVGDRVAALEAGLDLEMPEGTGEGPAAVAAAVRAGTLDEAVLDAAVTRVLTLVRRVLGAAPARPVDLDLHHALARQAAHECAVLLKNDPGPGGEPPLLPLSTSATGSLAVIGEFARTPRFQGAGSSQVTATRVDDALSQLDHLAGPALRIRFAPGYTVAAAAATEPPPVDEAVLVAEAVDLARESDVVVMFLGLPDAAETEGLDRTDLQLPANQVSALRAVAAVNPHVVVVLSNGAVVDVGAWQDQARAVLECWLLGQAGGGAVADLLFGVVSPSGKLAETIPERLEDTPAFGNFPGELGQVRYGEGVLVGYRGYDARRRPVAYPFGHGLSYTTFSYTDLALTLEADGTVGVAFTVANTGSRLGQEVAQVYVGDPEASVLRPPRELRAFSKVDLHPGESTRVALTLGPRDLGWFHPRLRRWVVEGGTIEVTVGASSRDLRLTGRVEVPGEDLSPPLTAWSTLEEWLADAAGRRVVTAALQAMGDPRLAEFEGSDGYRVVAGMPLVKVAGFFGMGREAVETLVQRVGEERDRPGA